MPKATRHAMAIGIKEDAIEEYRRLHAAVWPDVLAQIKECSIKNYSIYLGRLDDGYYLFSYFEYTGEDLEADMNRMAQDATTQKWWELCMPCQRPLPHREKNEWWMNMEEVFHVG